MDRQDHMPSQGRRSASRATKLRRRKQRMNALLLIGAIAAIDIFNEEIVFCSVVGWAHIDIAKFGSASFCRFQIETIVANETEDDAVAIDAVIAKHLFDHDFASPFALVGDILYKIRIACHDNFLQR